MNTTRWRYHIGVVAASLLIISPGAVFAQAVGADGTDGSTEELPGEATTAPPTAAPDDAVPEQARPGVHGDEAAPEADVDVEPEIDEGDHTATVRLRHATDDDVDVADRTVVLRAVRPPGPLQPDNFEQTVSTWRQQTDDEGLAHFDGLPDNLAAQGLVLRASTDYGELTFDSPRQRPSDGATIDLELFDQTRAYPGIRISEKRVLVSPWEEYLIIDQFWTLEVEGDEAFDISNSTDPALVDGLPLRLPYTAEGISLAGPGDYQDIDNIIYWNGVLQPNQPVTIQIRFSKSVRTSTFDFEQPMQYPVDDLSVLAAVDTDFNKVPRLDDLRLAAPGFEIGTDPADAGLPPHTTRDFLVATGHSVDADESYTFRLEGLPFSRPMGAWLALIGGILGVLFVAAYGRREYLAMRESQNDEQILEALGRQRDEILDELAAIEYEIDEVHSDDERLDLEHEQMLLRQRLTLILRKIEEIEERPDADAAA